MGRGPRWGRLYSQHILALGVFRDTLGTQACSTNSSQVSRGVAAMALAHGTHGQGGGKSQQGRGKSHLPRYPPKISTRPLPCLLTSPGRGGGGNQHLSGPNAVGSAERTRCQYPLGPCCRNRLMTSDPLLLPVGQHHPAVRHLPPPQRGEGSPVGLPSIITKAKAGPGIPPRQRTGHT